MKALPVTLVLTLLISGCTANNENFAERFLIELQASAGYSDAQLVYFQDLAEGLEKEAQEYCGNPAYTYGIAEGGEDFLYSWLVACHFNYPQNHSQAQTDEIMQMVLDRAMEGAKR